MFRRHFFLNFAEPQRRIPVTRISLQQPPTSDTCLSYHLLLQVP